MLSCPVAASYVVVVVSPARLESCVVLPRPNGSAGSAGVNWVSWLSCNVRPPGVVWIVEERGVCMAKRLSGASCCRVRVPSGAKVSSCAARRVVWRAKPSAVTKRRSSLPSGVRSIE